VQASCERGLGVAGSTAAQHIQGGARMDRVDPVPHDSFRARRMTTTDTPRDVCAVCARRRVMLTKESEKAFGSFPLRARAYNDIADVYTRRERINTNSIPKRDSIRVLAEQRVKAIIDNAAIIRARWYIMYIYTYEQIPGILCVCVCVCVYLPAYNHIIDTCSVYYIYNM